MSTEPLDQLRALAAALREVGVSHYDGNVPGWAAGTAVKLILGPPAEPPPAAAAEEAPTRRPLSRPLTEGDLDAAVLRHIAIHTEPPKAKGVA